MATMLGVDAMKTKLHQDHALVTERAAARLGREQKLPEAVNEARARGVPEDRIDAALQEAASGGRFSDAVRAIEGWPADDQYRVGR